MKKVPATPPAKASGMDLPVQVPVASRSASPPSGRQLADTPYSAKTLAVDGHEVHELSESASGLSVLTCPERGNEIAGISHRSGGQERQLLYRACQWEHADGWQGRAPWLWPAVGRSYLSKPRGRDVSNNELGWTRDGILHPMPMHGFVRHMRWEHRSAKATDVMATACADLASDEYSLPNYPFRFKLETITAIRDGRIETRFTVCASESNRTPMPFTVGIHFTFDLARWWGGDWPSATLMGLGPTGWAIDRFGLMSDVVQLPATHLDVSDQKIYDLIAPAACGVPVRLQSPAGDEFLSITQHADNIPDADAMVWVTHMDPRKRFFCVEPWVGWPDALNTGRGCMMLEPGRRWEWQVSLYLELLNDRPAMSRSHLQRESARLGKGAGRG